MFERDTAAHLQRHRDRGEVSVAMTISRAFEAGARDTPPRPGDQVMAYGRIRVGKRGRAKPELITAPAEDDALAVDEDVVVVASLDELLTS